MLNIFRTNNLLSLIALFLITVLIRIVPFFYFSPISLSINAPLAQFFFTYWQKIGNISNLNFVATTCIVFLQAIQLNYISTKHSVLHKDSMLPGLLFVLLNSLYAEQMVLTPQLIANTFLLLLIQKLFYLYESKKPLYLVLDAGMYLGIGILFNYDMINYLPFILISVVAMTSFNIRYFIVAIIGIFIPIYFTVALFYLSNHLNDFMSFVQLSFSKTYYSHISIDFIMAIPWLVMLIILFLSFVAIQSNYFKNNVKSRRVILTLALLFVFSILIVPLENNNFIFNLTYLSTPTSVIAAYYFLSSKKAVLKEIIFLFIVGCCFYFQFNH